MATDIIGTPGKVGLIGKAIRITGKLSGGEDLIIEGRIEGSIALEDHHLVLERSAVIEANADVKNITIRGQMNGNSVASQKVELCEQAKVEGDIKSPRLVMRDGAKFRGNVDMDVPLPDGLEPIAREPEPLPEPAAGEPGDQGDQGGTADPDNDGLDNQWD